MEMLGVAWDFGVQWRGRRVDDQMVVPGVCPVGARGRHSHAAQTEMDRGLGRYGVAVLQPDEINGGPRCRRCRPSGLGLGLRSILYYKQSKEQTNEQSRCSSFHCILLNGARRAFSISVGT